MVARIFPGPTPDPGQPRQHELKTESSLGSEAHLA
jgi:hypothetical protein